VPSVNPKVRINDIAIEIRIAAALLVGKQQHTTSRIRNVVPTTRRMRHAVLTAAPRVPLKSHELPDQNLIVEQPRGARRKQWKRIGVNRTLVALARLVVDPMLDPKRP
jgi:hypothetical protein